MNRWTVVVDFPMTEARSILQELNEAILQGSPESCARALWHATDILIAGAGTGQTPRFQLGDRDVTPFSWCKGSPHLRRPP